MILRPPTKIITLLALLFVLFTGYYPKHESFEGYEILSQRDLELESLSAARAVVLKDIKYGENNKQRFDIYLPVGRSAKTTKVLLLLHGGSWVRGDKSGMNSFVAVLMDRFPDHAIVNMNYTLANKKNFAFPNQFLDIQAVIGHLTHLSNEYEILPSFGIIGRSAGGHLGLMYDSKYDKHDQVKFVCSIAGPTNLTDPLYSRNPEFELLRTMLIDQEAFPKEPLKELSPLYNADWYSSPRLLIYAKDDKKVPISNGLDYSKKLEEINVPNELVLFEGGHSNTWDSEEWQVAYNNIETFVNLFLN